MILKSLVEQGLCPCLMVLRSMSLADATFWFSSAACSDQSCAGKSLFDRKMRISPADHARPASRDRPRLAKGGPEPIISPMALEPGRRGDFRWITGRER